MTPGHLTDVMALSSEKGRMLPRSPQGVSGSQAGVLHQGAGAASRTTQPLGNPRTRALG